MDELDRNLLDAWDRITATCRRDRREALKRARRQWSRTLTRPPRAWCLAIRAGDRRLTEQFGVVAREDDVEMGLAHEVLIDGAAIRRLCSPVSIKWPGVPLTEAAAMLGRHRESLRHWLPVRPGRSRTARSDQSPDRYREIRDRRFPLNVRYECAASHGHFGVDVPIVWTDGEVDPGFVRGGTPHPVWGSLWRSLAKRIPDDYMIEAKRLPRWRPYGNEQRFRGWTWQCPGRWVAIESLSAKERSEFDLDEGDRATLINDDGRRYVRRPCGREANVLYGPLPIYSIGRLLGGDGIELSADQEAAANARANIAMPQEATGSSLALGGMWFPGQSDSLAGLRSFACTHCWRVRNFSLCDYRGWNEFVSYISGGLLYGHEVPMPAGMMFERKVAYVKRSVGEELGCAKPRAAGGEVGVAPAPMGVFRSGRLGALSACGGSTTRSIPELQG